MRMKRKSQIRFLKNMKIDKIYTFGVSGGFALVRCVGEFSLLIHCLQDIEFKAIELKL